jgi:hypothetical protein
MKGGRERTRAQDEGRETDHLKTGKNEFNFNNFIIEMWLKYHLILFNEGKYKRLKVRHAFGKCV